MTKKYIIFLSLGILLIISSVFFILKNHQPVVDSLFKVIPEDAAFIFDIKDYGKFRSEINTNNKIWQELSQLSILSGIQHHLKLIDSLKNNNEFVKAFISENTGLLISGHPTGKSTLALLYCIKVTSKHDFQKINNIIQKTPRSVISERKYKGNTVYDMLLSPTRRNISFCYLNGVLLLSESSITLENALRKISVQSNIAVINGLDDLIKSAGKNAAVNVYINFKSLPVLGNLLFDPKTKKSINFLTYLGNWAELDLTIKPDVILLNGFSSSQHSNEGLKSIFEGQKPQKLEIFGKIPVNVNTFIAMALSNFELYWQNYQNFKALHNIGAQEKPTESFRNTYNIDLLQDFKKIFENEVGIAFVNNPTDSIQQIFTLIRIKDNEIAEGILRTWTGNIATSGGINENDAIKEISMDNEFTTNIYHVPGANIPAVLFGELFHNPGNDFCMLSDNYIIFGPSVEALKNYSQQISANNTLNTNIEFSEFADYFSTQTNFFFYNKPALSLNHIKSVFKQDLAGELISQPGQLNNIQAFVYQFNINNKGNIYNNIFVKYTQTKTDNLPKTTWETQLDGTCIIKPALVKNHLTRETEIIVQDDKYNVYLINKLGRILWKLNVEEPILSDIYQIDFFKNRKLQYLFNTAGKMYIIDRNGKNVKNSPILFKEKATNGLALFDYDKNRDYRIFIACEDKQVYLFDKYGKPENGWKAKKTEGIVKKPIRHFRFNAADYIVYNDDKNIYITNRRGKERVRPNVKFAISPNNEIQLITNKKNKITQFAVTDTAGLVYLVNTKGKVASINLGQFPSSHYFKVLDIDSDGSSEIILTSDKNLTAFSLNTNKLFQIVTENNISANPQVYQFSSKEFTIGVVTTDNDRIYLYNTHGELLKGFPLKGSTQFSINLLNNSENRFNLIVGSNRNFLYYYTVQ